MNDISHVLEVHPQGQERLESVVSLSSSLAPVEEPGLLGSHICIPRGSTIFTESSQLGSLLFMSLWPEWLKPERNIYSLWKLMDKILSCNSEGGMYFKSSLIVGAS